MPSLTTKPGYPIKIAALRSGLTAHIIRAWEKRYAVVKPCRSCTSRRLYSDEEIERLTLLRRATCAGYAIGNIARLADECLRKLAAEPPKPGKLKADPSCCPFAAMLDVSMAAVEDLNPRALESELYRGLAVHGRLAIMHQVLVPLIYRISERWHCGQMRIVHEHVASAAIRTLLGSFLRFSPETSHAPGLIVTTPAGQLHELGALLAGATAVDHGWRVTYLGPNLPAEEIAGAYLQSKADALAISLIYPGDDPSIVPQLRLLRRLLPRNAPIVAGGRAARDYRPILTETKAVICADLSELVCALNRIRRKRAEQCAPADGNGGA